MSYSIVEKVIALNEIMHFKNVKKLVDKNRQFLKNLQQKLNIVINIEENTNGSSVRITGKPIFVDLAVVQLFELINNLEKRSCCFTIHIPTSIVGYLIGRHGKSIKEISLATGCGINFGKDDNGSTNIDLLGSFNDILRCSNVVKERIQFKNKLR